MKCRHCGDEVIFTGHTAQGFDTDYIHANMIRRCLPAKSGKPYGLEADILTEDERRAIQDYVSLDDASDVLIPFELIETSVKVYGIDDRADRYPE